MQKSKNPLRKLQFRKIWVTLGWIQIILIIYLSLVHEPPDIMPTITSGDKIGHFVAYSILMNWFCQIYVTNFMRLALGIIFILMGIVLEVLQGLSGIRMFEFFDMVANTTGVAMGYLAAYLGLNQFLNKLENILEPWMRSK